MMISDYVMTNQATIAIAVIALTAGQVEAADFAPLSDDSVIIVSADESWEDPEQDTIHFRGNFEIRTPQWTLAADRATVYGELEDPQRVVADGSPVRFAYRHTESGKPSITQGEGQHLEYDGENELLVLSGNARISTDKRIMQSSEMRYNLQQQNLEAGGSEGVQITIEADNSGEF
jgi:lipopolysaccharide transport protein LptA